MVGVLLAGLGRLLAEIPSVVEWHRTTAFPYLAAILQGISRPLTSTLGEVAAMVLIATAVGALVVRRTRALGTLVFVLGFLVFALYGAWGLGYRYASLSTRLGAGEKAPPASYLVELAEASAALASRAGQAQVSFSGSEGDLFARINAGLDEGFSRLPEMIEASPIRGVVFGPAKPSRVSFALSRLELSGYYFPWTGEAQINAQMPRSLWPRVAAHEKAHQRGFARENEATVIGVLACLASSDPAVFYSGTLGLYVGFDHELARADPEARRRIWATLPSGVVNDFRGEAAFWKRNEGVASVVSEKVNDTYLKAQGIRSGVGSYAETTRLILQAVDTPSLNLGRLLRATEPLASPK